MTRPSSIQRGDRTVHRLDLNAAHWERNEFGVDVLLLSQDATNGAITMALRTPAGLQFPEEAHFYDCDQDLFQFEGEFHHDEERPFHRGDYVYRPPGTVYGNSVGSSGGTIIASLNRQPIRFHFQNHPDPWTGEYLVDRLWADRPVSPMLVRERDMAWTPCPLGFGLEIKKLRGEPGLVTPLFGACEHSPWGADSAFMLKLPAGFDGDIPEWPNTILEVLTTEGRAEIDGEAWHRGCYAFGGLYGHCCVIEPLILYVRAFKNPAS